MTLIKSSPSLANICQTLFDSLNQSVSTYHRVYISDFGNIMSSQPASDHANLGPLVLTVCWTLAGISTILFTLRVLTRVKTQHGLRVNDYVMTLSLVSLPRSRPFQSVLIILKRQQDLWYYRRNYHQRRSVLGPRKALESLEPAWCA